MMRRSNRRAEAGNESAGREFLSHATIQTGCSFGRGYNPEAEGFDLHVALKQEGDMPIARTRDE